LPVSISAGTLQAEANTENNVNMPNTAQAWGERNLFIGTPYDFRVNNEYEIRSILSLYRSIVSGAGRIHHLGDAVTVGSAVGVSVAVTVTVGDWVGVRVWVALGVLVGRGVLVDVGVAVDIWFGQVLSLSARRKSPVCGMCSARLSEGRTIFLYDSVFVFIRWQMVTPARLLFLTILSGQPAAGAGMMSSGSCRMCKITSCGPRISGVYASSPS
jgi:hypothetical protein